MSCRLYKILGVAKTAQKQEIKKAYQKLAFQFHPDKHTNSPPQTRAAAAEKFKQINNAYEILSDDSKRANYNAAQREDNHYSAQYRQSCNNHTKSSAEGQDQAESPSVAQTRRSNSLTRRAAAAALKFLRHVCVEFMRFTARIAVEIIAEVVARVMVRIMFQILLEVLKAVLQPSSTKKVEDEKKK
ncbi:hypothetical protein OROHE_014267 [Orobanche hederae]